MDNLTKLQGKAKLIRRHILKMHSYSGTSHVGSSLSCVDLLAAVFFSFLKVNPKKPDDKKRDRFILSKGHASSALYATLAERGFFRKGLLKKYCLNDNLLSGHSTKGNILGVEVSTGSLGHGLSIGIGVAIAGRLGKSNYKVVALLSDGECDEGSVWEAAMFAGHHKLENLLVIIDYNKLQAFGRTKEVLDLEPFKDKWIAFGWSCREINGHNLKDILNALNEIPFNQNKPSCIIAHTVKGRGVSFMEDRLEWHYKAPDKAQLKKALSELNSK